MPDENDPSPTETETANPAGASSESAPLPVFYTEAEQAAMTTPVDPHVPAAPVEVVPVAVVPPAPPLDEQLSLAKLQLGLADVLAKVAEEMHDLFTPSTRASVKTAIAAYRSVRKAG